MTDESIRCVRCGAVIPPERLEAMLETRVCVKCSEEIGGEFKNIVVPGDTHKDGSLRHNYSEWNVIRVRRTIRPKGGERE